MSDVAIRVEHLSKAYKIRHQQTAKRYATLREDLMRLPAALMGKLRNQDETFWALDDVSFDIHEGEVVGIIGRNGAGKSTLLKILARITEPTHGRAEIYGRVGSLLEVGTGFHPELTGRENIYLSGAILGMTRAEIRRKFDEIVDFAEVEKFLDTPAKHYSSGMYVRLAFAVAAHLEPEILLVDEVLAVGDAQFQKKCLGKMGEVAKGGRTVLFVSHNMGAVRQLCEQSILLKSGKLNSIGPTENLITEYIASSNENLQTYSPPKKTVQDFSITSVLVSNPTHSVPNAITLTSGVKVELYYDLITETKGMNVVIHLWNSSGICVLSSTDVDSDFRQLEVIRRPGQYRASCVIPFQFLRPGRYFISVSASIPNIRVLEEVERAVSFEIPDTGGIESKLGQGRQGIVSPILGWKTELLGKGYE